MLFAPTSPLHSCAALWSIGGLVVSVAVGGALEDLRGGRDLGLGGLQDRVLAGSGPGGERRAEITVIRVFRWDPLALPVREPVGEGAVSSGQVLGAVSGRQGTGEEVGVALVAGGGGLGGPDRVQQGQVIGVGQGLVAGLGSG